MEVNAVNLQEIEFDAEGFLLDYQTWNEELAKKIAEEESISELTPRHWDVINYMRKEFAEKGEVPTIRRLKKSGGIPTKELYALFPNGPAKKAARIAGLPKPKGCV